MKNILYIFLLVLLSSGSFAGNRLAIYWQMPTMTEQDAQKIAKFDLAIVDLENWANVTEVDRIKEINPNCTVLTYFNPMEMFDPQVGDRPIQSIWYNGVSNLNFDWWLDQPDGQPIYYWHSPRMRMLNLSSKCPVIKGFTWGEHLAGSLNSAMVPWVDGLFIDNTFNDVSWMKDGFLDANRDGIQDNLDSLDLWWQEGMSSFLQLLESDILVGNEANLEYQNLLHGKMWENFPPADFANDWYAAMQNYFQLSNMPFNIIHGEMKGERWRMFVLCSALLGDGYFSYGTNHIEWYSEYDLISKLGEPVNNAESPHELVWEQTINGPGEESMKIVSDLLPAGEYIVSYEYSLIKRGNGLICEARSEEFGGVFPYSQQIHGRWLEGFVHQKVKLTSEGRIVWHSRMPAVISAMQIWKVQKGPWVRKYKGGEVSVYPNEQIGDITLYQ
jgi:hypothetical protein